MDPAAAVAGPRGEGRGSRARGRPSGRHHRMGAPDPWQRVDRIPNGRPKPIGTIYQPEVAADAIWFAAHARRKEIVVGAPAMAAIMADKISSSLFDRYLARNAVEQQYEGRPVAATRRDNLFEPVPGDHGAHGRFEKKASAHSPLLWASMNRGWLAAALGLIAAAAFVANSRRS